MYVHTLARRFKACPGAEPSPHGKMQVVTLEQPELEDRHHNLITSIATDKKQLLELEDQILGLLNDAGSGVNVLEDEVCPCLQVRPYHCTMTADAKFANVLVTDFFMGPLSLSAQ